VAMPASVLAPGEETAEYLHVTGPGVEPAFWYFREDTQLRLLSAGDAMTVATTRTPDGYEVRVTATALVKDLCLFPDRLDAAARVDSGVVTLAAGESHTFRVASSELDAEALSRTPVLRSVNDLR
jgi:beta-mannosidase